MWWVGLLLLRVPLAPVWALIGGVMTFVPNFGGVITVIFPVLTVLFSGHDMYRLGLVLGLYALIVLVDQLALQPFLLKRVSRIPIWASILVPIRLGLSFRSGAFCWRRRCWLFSTPSKDPEFGSNSLVHSPASAYFTLIRKAECSRWLQAGLPSLH